jgi:hypothetical protein
MFVVNNCTKLKSTIVYKLFKNDSRKKEKNLLKQIMCVVASSITKVSDILENLPKHSPILNPLNRK